MELFTEEYRPKTWEEMVGQKEVVGGVRKMVESNNLSHLLFYGNAGVGKTTLALVIVRSLFGEDWKSNFLELNASDERGIGTIREKVKEFAKVKPLNAGFKVIFLDEADHLTQDAQASLRRIMEVYAKTTRFILSCNYLAKIIEPVKSRCKIYRFNGLEKDEIEDYLSRILILRGQDEKIFENVIKGISENCKGDLRCALNELQAIVGLKIGMEKLDLAKGNRMKEFWEEVMKGNLLQSRAVIDGMLREGVDGRRLLVEMREFIVKRVLLKDLGFILLQLMKADERLVLGVAEELVMDGLVAELIK